MAGLDPTSRGREAKSDTVTITFDADGAVVDSQATQHSVNLSGGRKLLKGYEQCIGMILVLVISFSTLVALLKDIYEQGHGALLHSTPLGAVQGANYTLLNDTIKAYFLP